jgi:hypothetical protein
MAKIYSRPAIVRRDPVTLTAAAKILSITKPVMKPSPCWVARAVYGEDNPRWLLFRDWLAFQAPAWLRGGYVRHGESFARLVRHSALLRGLLRPAMDRAIRGRFGC